MSKEEKAPSGILVVLSGFSGSGKGTMISRLTAEYPDEYALSVSATTRAPRPGEREGREYFFKSTEEFESMIAAGELIEYAKYVDHYYGTPLSYVNEQMADGKSVILEIETQGALLVREKFPKSRLIFVAPPSAEELRRRLIGRGTEDAFVIESRLLRAAEEAKVIGSYDYLIVNDDLQRAVSDLYTIIEAERAGDVSSLGPYAVLQQSDFIGRIQKELSALRPV